MRLLLVVAAAVLISASLLSSATQEEDPAETQMQHISYGVGFYQGNEIRMGLAVDGIDADLEQVVEGYRDGLKGTTPIVPEAQLDIVLRQVREAMEKRKVDLLLNADPSFRKRYDENLERSRFFHEAFGAKEGVVTLSDGMQYLVVRPGRGPQPSPQDTVKVNVRMMLIDGTQIGEWNGATFRVDKLIEGGAKVLPRMKVGATWVAAVPPQLAFGSVGRPPEIGPNETIMFGVDLLEIQQ